MQYELEGYTLNLSRLLAVLAANVPENVPLVQVTVPPLWFVAVVAVDAFPEILIPHVPDAPVPVGVGIPLPKSEICAECTIPVPSVPSFSFGVKPRPSRWNRPNLFVKRMLL
jgi:hypothetical protein